MIIRSIGISIPEFYFVFDFNSMLHKNILSKIPNNDNLELCDQECSIVV